MQHVDSLKDKTMTGLFWSLADLMANHGIQFIIQIILARLLLPEHFGIIGMIIILIAISNSIVDSGFSQALIRDQNTSQEDYSTIFYFNLFIALVIYGILFISSNVISTFFGEPQLIKIIRVLSLVLIINSLGLIQRVMLIKSIDFKTITKTGIIAAIISGSITIVFALLGFGVWSLVINILSMQFIQTTLLWFFNKWLPKKTFNRQSFKKFFRFGYKLLLSGLIDTFYNNLFFVIIGKSYSVTQLGFYSNASKLRDNASLAILISVQRVTYPVLSSIREDQKWLKSGFRKIMKTTAFITFPITTGLIAVANPLFTLLLGEKWIPSVIYFQLLCVAGMLYPINAINLDILKVKGRSDLFLLIEIISKTILTILIVLSLWFELGIIGLIGAAVLSTYINLCINAYFSAREIAYTGKEQLMDLLPIYLISISMGIVVYMVGEVLPSNPYVELFCQVSIGVVIYISACKLARVQELNTVYRMIWALVMKIKSALNNTKSMVNRID
ncbi:lipopolysaccharide biosynthesis protein [Sporosarcina limicola]|uniref:O-antigen/teichoic acid export membrane protein n=1 Tax=Sporosarcina limicola TaxID=34101 RepID=A0A927MKN1_9BACL|nr:lipopolysaccharide biosynthesis protein [Sporosarcina limicola]MBE1556489.1 O-antigen/teichoic acid export membrane protein [Sporosarcina limicola]